MHLQIFATLVKDIGALSLKYHPSCLCVTLHEIKHHHHQWGIIDTRVNIYTYLLVSKFIRYHYIPYTYPPITYTIPYVILKNNFDTIMHMTSNFCWTPYILWVLDWYLNMVYSRPTLSANDLINGQVRSSGKKGKIPMLGSSLILLRTSNFGFLKSP
jgi:hypothetical protein